MAKKFIITAITILYYLLKQKHTKLISIDIGPITLKIDSESTESWLDNLALNHDCFWFIVSMNQSTKSDYKGKKWKKNFSFFLFSDKIQSIQPSQGTVNIKVSN